MLTLCTFLFFTGLVAFLSWRYTRRDEQGTSTGYFLAGRSLTWFVIGGSLLLTNLSTEQLVGLNGGAFKDGMEIMAWELGAAVAMVVMALFCLPRYLKGGITTVPEFLESRYNRMTRGLISLLILVSVSVSVLPFVLYSGAIFMRDVFDVPQLFAYGDPVVENPHILDRSSLEVGLDEDELAERESRNRAALWLMIISIGVVGSLYAIFGGLRAVAISDTLNGIGLFVAGLMIPLLGLWRLGEGSFRQAFVRLQSDHPERLNPFGDATSGVPWATLFTGVALLHLYYWCTNQFIVQRTFAARSLWQGQQGVLFAASLKLLGPFYLILPGVIAFHLYRDQITEDGNLAYSTLVRGLLPRPLLGFFAAAIFGAILSSFNSALNSCATLFSVDIYKGFIRPRAKDEELVRVGKIFGTLLAALIISLAPLLDGRGAVFEVMKKVAATFDVPLMAIVFVGLFSRRTGPAAAWAAAAVGVTFYSLVTFWGAQPAWESYATWFGIPLGGLAEPLSYVHDYVRRLHQNLNWLHVAGVNFVLMMSVMGLFRLIKPRRTPFIHKYTEDVEIDPWPWAVPVGISIIVGVLLLYGGLWWVSR